MRVLSLIFAASLLSAPAAAATAVGHYLISFGFAKEGGSYAGYLSDRQHCLRDNGKSHILGPGSDNMFTDIDYDPRRFQLCMAQLGYTMDTKGRIVSFVCADSAPRLCQLCRGSKPSRCRTGP